LLSLLARLLYVQDADAYKDVMTKFDGVLDQDMLEKSTKIARRANASAFEAHIVRNLKRCREDASCFGEAKDSVKSHVKKYKCAQDEVQPHLWKACLFPLSVHGCRSCFAKALNPKVNLSQISLAVASC
jgi:hypothetical protein